ncbi:DUF2059 domain-containing protein [Hydrogenophaga sp. NFH-34]|uniref:DUF2059 domain-containing protein n=1 Tax=Hydrogenophaga sp. NFH-34 TaxID=2744446 RepID=UPI001F45C5C4|nr:DUF2059 domain-containing protein [Hydrogenophaga sp. NFH-34]
MKKSNFIKWTARAGLVAGAMALSSIAAAQSAVKSSEASVAAVEKLLAFNGAQKALETAVGGIEAQMRQQIIASLVQQNAGQALSAQQQAAVDKAVPGIGAVMRQELGWARLKEPYVKLYQAQLSPAEVERLTKLYQDPAYVTLMEKMQTINVQSAQLVAQRMPVILQRIQPVLEDALKQSQTAR